MSNLANHDNSFPDDSDPFVSSQLSSNGANTATQPDNFQSFQNPSNVLSADWFPQSYIQQSNPALNPSNFSFDPANQMNLNVAQPTSYINETDPTAANVGYGGPIHGDSATGTSEPHYYPGSPFADNYLYDHNTGLYGWNGGAG